MKNKKKYSLFFVALLLFTACSKDDVIISSNELDISGTVRDTSIVTIDIAESLAKDVFKFNNGIYSKNGKKKTIESITPIGTDKKSPSYYIINYNNGGFLILSGDKRTYPVLAYSTENTFDLKTSSYPDLLVKWLQSQDNYIHEMRNDTVVDVIATYKLWNAEEIERFISHNDYKNQKTSKATAFSCDSQPMAQPILIATQGPLIETYWGQGTGFNNLAPYYGCPLYSNGRVPTGCVATAMSQIMKYYQYPANYNWSIMPNVLTEPNSSGANEISRLMNDAGNSVGMDWGCDGSSAEAKDVPGALKSNFGYSSANYADFDITTTYNELVNGYPVILRGGEKETKWLIFNVYENGHAWVCDGMEYYRIKLRIAVGRFGYDTTCMPEFTYHMNWGWNGNYNGWYSDFSNPVGSFHYKAGMVYNIRK